MEPRRLNEYVHISKDCPCCGMHHSQLPLDSKLDNVLRLYFFQCEGDCKRCGGICEDTLSVSLLDPTVIFKPSRSAA